MAELAPSTKPAPLEPSALGTKEYWDALYTTELVNHAADPADEGTVWFDDSDAQDKVLTYLDELLLDSDSGGVVDAGSGHSFGLDKRTTTFLDLGCGNGALLFGLRDAGWRGRLLGVDYSAQSVALARQVGEARAAASATETTREEGEGEEEEEEGEEEVQETERDDKQDVGVVDFLAWDVLNGPLDAVGAGGWDVVLDKGTFDAVSLSDERDARGRRICEAYRPRVLRLLRPGGLFLVTSCNWTEAELRAWFSGDEEDGGEDGAEEVEGKLRPVGRIAYRNFSFGGVQGQTISTVCFAKVI